MMDSNTAIFTGGMGLILFALGAWAISAVRHRMKANSKIKAPFTSKVVFNKTEQKLHGVMERWRQKHARHLYLSMQVAYGAFLSAETKSLWFSVASKRADFVFIGRDGYVKAIIECDGHGHYGGNRKVGSETHARDTVKNEAALSASIPLIRIPQEATNDEIENILTEVLLPGIKPIVVSNSSDHVSKNKHAFQ